MLFPRFPVSSALAPVEPFYSPALTDFNIMTRGDQLHVLDWPESRKTVTGEDVTQEQLGGASVHTTKSG